MSSIGVPIYNPIAPSSFFVKFKLGSNMYEGNTPNFIKFFSFEKILGGRGNFSITLSDMQDYELEAKIIESLSKGIPNISFQYGHSPGDVSPWYRGMLLNYTSEVLRNFNANFTLTGIADMSLGTTLNRTYYLRDYDYRYSNLIKKIALDEGWKIGNPFVLSDRTTDEEVSVTNQSTLNFISTLVSKTKKDSNATMFRHFCTGSGVTVILDTNLSMAEKLPKREYTFTINSGNYGNVISYTPSYNSWANIATKIEAGYVDRVTNQFTLFQNNPNLGKTDNVYTQYFGATSTEEFNSVLHDNWVNTKFGMIGTASMEVFGDPSIDVLDMVKIIPIRPDGRLHHSAGIYQISKVSDELSGSFRTTLEMFKIPMEKSDEMRLYKSGWGNG